MNLSLSAEEWAAVVLSLRVATVCVAVTLVPGVTAGWLLARVRFPGKAIVDACLHLPLVLPPVVVGYILLLLLSPRGMVGGWLGNVGVSVAFTWWAAVLASAVMGFPLLVRAVRLTIELVDVRLEQAARTLGASPWRVWWTVTLPLAMPGVLTGAVLAFARSLGEFGATVMFAGNIEGETRTLPLALYTYTQVPGGDGAAMRLAMLSILLAFAALLASEWLARRMRRAMGAA